MMAKITTLRKHDVSPQVLLARAMEDVGQYDQVVVAMGNENETDFRWSHMSLRDLIFLHVALGEAIRQELGAAKTDGL